MLPFWKSGTSASNRANQQKSASWSVQHNPSLVKRSCARRFPLSVHLLLHVCSNLSREKEKEKERERERGRRITFSNSRNRPARKILENLKVSVGKLLRNCPAARLQFQCLPRICFSPCYSSPVLLSETKREKMEFNSLAKYISRNLRWKEGRRIELRPQPEMKVYRKIRRWESSRYVYYSVIISHSHGGNNRYSQRNGSCFQFIFDG